MRGALARYSPIVAGQLVLAMSALLAVAFAPPARGRMLLVPLGGKAVTPELIQSHRATPLKPGPLPGSWVVDGEYQSLSGMLSNEILILAAPAAICASSVSSEGSSS
jgi:hypothetical protein